jgi:toxin ParE1/3/4
MTDVIWLDEALEDLKSIGNYIAQDNPQAAYKVLLTIKSTADALAEQPLVGRKGRVNQTRELVIRDLPYIVPYTITSENIQILAVMHTARKWPNQFENLDS